jgi:hypothetical protein
VRCETEPETETGCGAGRFGCPQAEDRQGVSETEIRAETEPNWGCGASAGILEWFWHFTHKCLQYAGNLEKCMAVGRCIVAAVFVVIVSFSSPLLAFDEESVRLCSKISEAIKRLDCYDLAVRSEAKDTKLSTQEREVRDAVLGALKDPDSAKFGLYTKVSETKACQTVNARTPMGGYSGDKVAVVVKAEGQWVAFFPDIDISHQVCKEVLEKQ